MTLREHMMHMSPHKHLLLWPPALVGFAALLSGCVSVDPTADYEEAMSLVEQRSGWRPDWNTPWSGAVTIWDGTSPLSSHQVVTIALQNNRQLRATLEGIAAARADLVQSGLLPNPVLSAAYGPSIGGDPGAATISVSFVQQLTDLWLLPARKDAAASALREQILGISDTALRLVADVQQDHARLVYAQRGIRLTRSHLDLVERSIDLSRQRVAAGEASQLDVNRVQQLSLGLQADLSQQELERDRQKRALLQALGLADGGADWQAENVVPPLETWLDELTESDLIELATQQRLDVAAAEKVYETVLHELRVANLGSIPELGAGAVFDRDEDGRRSLGPQIDLEVPIFDNNRARIVRVASDLRRARFEADAVLQRAVTETRSAWLDVRTNLDLVDFYLERVIALARENLRLAEGALRAGQVDMTVVLETQRELILAEFRLNQLKAAAALALIELEYAVGGHLGRLQTAAVPEPRETAATAVPGQSSSTGESS